ncbi:transmembrane protein 109 isoform X2 [Oryzias latipes]|uniref:Si:dkey-74k8.3 n=1 Tax=Oryzias latipes TaxID=8090 RepID=A0A3B3HHK1_ORYLA|nr:transmembrane protein 109 isoform X2 [Oryzias latipes]
MVRLLSAAWVLVLVALWVEAAAGEDQATAGSAPVVSLRTLITGTCQEIQRHAESILGTTVIQSTAEILQTAIRFLAEGAASGLNVIAVYVTEILRVTGFNAALTLPRFTPEGVTSIAQWGLGCLIGYWLLTILLRLLISVLKHVFWTVKTVLALWVFGLIVLDKSASTDTTAFRLGGLVLTCVLLSLYTTDFSKHSAVENRLSKLEGRLKAVEKK